MAALTEAATPTLTYTEYACTASGVPLSDIPTITSLCTHLSLSPSNEPMCDPLTLLRFTRAREGDVGKAGEMWTGTVEWRKECGLKGRMGKYGKGCEYDGDGSRVGDECVWKWRYDKRQSDDATLVHSIGFFGRLSENTAGGEPVAVWRIGKCDLKSMKTHQEKIVEAFSTHMEDLMQAGRAESFKQKKMVRTRLIIDLEGIGIGAIPYLSVIRAILGLGKQYFPEVTASATLINAPWVFSKIWGLVKPMLTTVMQAKVCILGREWEEGLREHSGLERRVLPKCIGGEGEDEDVGQCQVAPASA